MEADVEEDRNDLMAMLMMTILLKMIGAAGGGKMICFSRYIKCKLIESSFRDKHKKSKSKKCRYIIREFDMSSNTLIRMQSEKRRRDL